MKKLFVLSCIALFALSSFAKVGDNFNVGGFSYLILSEFSDRGEVSLVANPTSTELYVPASVSYNDVTYSVSSIAPDAFKNTLVKNVALPESIEEIGKGAFQNCKELTSVTLPSSLVTIGYSAFAGCEKLTEITIPSKVSYIGRQAFADCVSLTKVNIPESLTTMGEDVFLNCTSLTEVDLPSNMSSIKEGMFEMCSQLNLNITPNIQYIDSYAFNGCAAMKSICLSEQLEGLGAFAFAGCESLTELTIPQSISRIPDGTFAYCTKIKKIALPNSVVAISSGAFKNNTSLTHVTLPSALASLGVGDKGGVFDRCDAMTELTIPAYVEEVGDISTFPSCLNSIYIMGNKIPDGLASMESTNRLGEKITIYVKPSVYNNLYSSGEWNGFTVDYRIPVQMINAKGNAVKYKTMCRDFDVDLRYVNDNLPEGTGRLCAYVVDDANGELGMVFMDEIPYIPSRLKANVENYVGEDEYVGVVLKGTPGCTYYYQIGENDYSQGDSQWLLADAQSASKAPHAGTNLMKGVADASFITSQEVNQETGQTVTNYGVSNNAFRKISGPGWIGYNKSYLPLPENMANANITMTFTDADGTTDTINITEFLNDCDDGDTYDLLGRRVNDSYKGIVIKNGKKIHNRW